MTWRELGLELIKGMGLVVMGNYLIDAISKVNKGVGSPADKKMVEGFYEKLNEIRQQVIDTQIDYHQGCLKKLNTEKLLLLQNKIK